MKVLILYRKKIHKLLKRKTEEKMEGKDVCML